MSRPHWKSVAHAYKRKYIRTLNRAVHAERELSDVPKAVRIVCREVCRLLRGKV